MDVGEVRIGLAVSNDSGTICSPIKSLDASNTDNDLEQISFIAESEKASRIVVGIPIDLNGRKGKAARKILARVTRLKKFTSLPVLHWDERMTTQEANRRLFEVKMSSKRRKQRIDGIAAAIILQAYLEYELSKL